MSDIIIMYKHFNKNDVKDIIFFFGNNGFVEIKILKLIKHRYIKNFDKELLIEWSRSTIS